ncbi:MAG: ATP-binding protein, partial [Gemmatimonadetes bacterium]|nr:ATP-binding protein [Gemmatimonadota bacterium]
MDRALDPELVFARFVIGAENLLAATAARRVAESPGRSYNPLVVIGAGGAGKTHLLTAIGHLARATDPDAAVQYESADRFVDRLTASIAEGTVAEM